MGALSSTTHLIFLLYKFQKVLFEKYMTDAGDPRHKSLGYDYLKVVLNDDNGPPTASCCCIVGILRVYTPHPPPPPPSTQPSITCIASMIAPCKKTSAQVLANQLYTPLARLHPISFSQVLCCADIYTRNRSYLMLHQMPGLSICLTVPRVSYGINVFDRFTCVLSVVSTSLLPVLPRSRPPQPPKAVTPVGLVNCVTHLGAPATRVRMPPLPGKASQWMLASSSNTPRI
jgi:hypothetical protein